MHGLKTTLKGITTACVMLGNTKTKFYWHRINYLMHWNICVAKPLTHQTILSPNYSAAKLYCRLAILLPSYFAAQLFCCLAILLPGYFVAWLFCRQTRIVRKCFEPPCKNISHYRVEFSWIVYAPILNWFRWSQIFSGWKFMLQIPKKGSVQLWLDIRWK